MSVGRSPRPVILMYHSVSARGPHPDEREWVLTPPMFRAHLRLMRALGRTPVPMSAALDQRPQPDAVIITFDDAYADFRAAALPLLRQFECPATLFVPTAHVGGADAWERGGWTDNRPLLAWDELAEVAAQPGVTIGSHSRTHPSLPTLSLPEARVEIHDSRRELEERLGITVRYFAYPYNRYRPHLQQLVQEGGYSAAVSGEWGEGSRFALPRENVSGSGLFEFAFRLLGLRAHLKAVKQRVRRAPAPAAPQHARDAA